MYNYSRAGCCLTYIYNDMAGDGLCDALHKQPPNESTRQKQCYSLHEKAIQGVHILDDTTYNTFHRRQCPLLCFAGSLNQKYIQGVHILDDTTYTFHRRQWILFCFARSLYRKGIQGVHIQIIIHEQKKMSTILFRRKQLKRMSTPESLLR
jgi:hypothetical protein